MAKTASEHFPELPIAHPELGISEFLVSVVSVLLFLTKLPILADVSQRLKMSSGFPEFIATCQNMVGEKVKFLNVRGKV